MLRPLLIFAGALAALLFVPSISSAQSFEYSFSVPDHVVGIGGGTVEYEVECLLDSSGIDDGTGVEAWAVGVTALDGARIVGATTEGTAGAERPVGYRLPFDSFERTELTTGSGNEGVISAVLLSLDERVVSLPPSGRVPILRLTIEADVPEKVVGPEALESCTPLESRVAFRDGLHGSAQPVDNAVTYLGLTHDPARAGEGVTTVCPELDNDAAYRVDVLSSPAERAGFDGDAFRWNLRTPPSSSTAEVELGLVLTTSLESSGAQGWSASLEVAPELELVNATTDGTAGDLGAQGFDGFQHTEIVDPAANGGRHGAVTAVVLCLSECDTTLPLESESLVLRATAEVDLEEIAAPGDAIGPYAARPIPTSELGLVGSAQPVKTAVVVDGETVATQVVGAELSWIGAEPHRFVRGEINDDESVDISDPIYLLDYLFQGGPPLACRKAGDTNDDGSLDISDPTYLLNFLFLGGPTLPAPFPGCGIDETSDELSCDEPSSRCE